MQDIVFTEGILRWYAESGRDLPWRRTRDPYAVWLSEIILQQTRIAQGTAYWERFMERFPTVQDLAAASEDEVLRLWQGLGYYSRARNLHAAARQIADLGGFPSTLEGIRALPGVGDYTAAAIGSIAFGLPAAVVDGNVYRVLARYYGIATPVGTTAAKKEFTALATSLLPSDCADATLSPSSGAAAFNQGMMDFGAMVCTPLSPRCTDCPLAAGCRAYREGRVAFLPMKKPAAAVQERHLTYIYIRCNGFTAIHRRGPGDIWQGLWEPIVLSVPDDSSAPKGTLCSGTPHPSDAPAPPNVSCVPALQELVSVGPLPLPASGGGHVRSVEYPSSAPLRLVKHGVKHQLTHRTIYADFYLWECAERPSLPPDYIWVQEPAFLTDYGKPRLVERLLEAL